MDELCGMMRHDGKVCPGGHAVRLTKGSCHHVEMALETKNE
jgi:hypothetical protein